MLTYALVEKFPLSFGGQEKCVCVCVWGGFNVSCFIILYRDVKHIFSTVSITFPESTSLIRALSHTCMEIDHEIISTVGLLLPLIQEGLLSVTSESMCTKYWLTS